MHPCVTPDTKPRKQEEKSRKQKVFSLSKSLRCSFRLTGGSCSFCLFFPPTPQDPPGPLPRSSSVLCGAVCWYFTTYEGRVRAPTPPPPLTFGRVMLAFALGTIELPPPDPSDPPVHLCGLLVAVREDGFLFVFPSVSSRSPTVGQGSRPVHPRCQIMSSSPGECFSLKIQ